MGNGATFFIGFIATSIITGKISSALYERAVKKELNKDNKNVQ